MPAAGDDKKVAVFGARDYRAGRFIWHIGEKRNSRQFLELLEQITRDSPEGLQSVLVMDNAGYHRANNVEGFLQKRAEQLEPFWLPPYSPELNLIEHVWLYLKENVTNNHFYGDLDALARAVEGACEQLAGPDDRILRINFTTGKHLHEAA